MIDETIQQENNDSRNGEIRIANDVIAVIAGMALCDLPGIYIDSRNPDAFIDKANAKNITKSVKIDINEGMVGVAITISVEYGKDIADLCVQVQEKIKNAVQTMTGLSVYKVDVNVIDIIFKKEQKGDNKK